MSGDKLLPEEPSAKKTKAGKKVKEVIKPEIKRAAVEEMTSTNPYDFLTVDKDLDYIYFGSNTESETDSYSNSGIDFL